jgi:hypothetical protein
LEDQGNIKHIIGQIMSKKMGQTHDRSKAIISDCIRKIAEDNISHKDWCEYASEQYNITIRRAEQVWSQSWKEIRDTFAVDAEQNLQQAVMRLDALYADARKRDADWNTLSNLLKEKHRLLGLGKENIEVRSEVRLSFDFNSDEV